MNLGMLLEMAVEGAGDRVLVGPRDGGLTAVQLHERARRAAAQFSAQEVARVALVDVNSEVVPIALFAAGFAGLPFAPLNYRLGDDQLGEIIDRLAPVAIVAGPDTVDRVRGRVGVAVFDHDLGQRDRACAEHPRVTGAVDGDAPAVILFTSGTTGAAKAAVLRHRHLVSYVIGTVEFLGADDDEAQLVSVPPYHIAAVSTILTSVYSGRRIVYLPTFDAELWVKTAETEAVSHAMVVPTMLGRILDVIDAHNVRLPRLRHLSYGGGRMPVEVIERAMRVLPHVDFVNAYGLTETSSTIAMLGPDEHRTAFAGTDASVRARLRSVGRPVPGLEVEIRGVDGIAVAAGDRGEIYVRGEQVAGEYIGRSSLTDDGWFPTNDAGYFDDAGFLYLEGRLDDVIVRGAENLSPVEIEDVLMAHEAVIDAGVVGVPNQEWGEAVVAAVVLAAGARADEDELRTWVRERLRSTKTPEHIEFRDELPYGETGKLLRRILRSELAIRKE
jgi:acyl-CoA synthetase (AMP-forming)/AMP-acid ligase II